MDSKPNEQIMLTDLNSCTYVNQRHQFGETTSADVKLQIYGPNREEYKGNPLHLHSETLQNSEFFKTLLSDRWSSDVRPFEIEVTTCQCFENYLRCIEMMYSSTSSLRFSDVDECLSILSVASELLVSKFIQQCMTYLEAVPWNSEQESTIRDLLSSLNLNLSVFPDFNARLNKQKNEYLDFVGENFKAMLSFLSTEERADDKQPNIREAVGKFIVENLQGDACSSSGIADMCRRSILEALKFNIVFIRSHIDVSFNATKRKNGANEEHSHCVLLWPFKVIERCDPTTMEAAVRILCENLKPSNIRPGNVNRRKIMLPFLLGCLEALGNGKIIVERKLRVGFVTTWLPVMAELIHNAQHGPPNVKDDEELKTRFCRGVINVMEPLPLDDWRGIYKIWIRCCVSYYIDLSIPFAWSCKLLQKLHD
ncbi:hypothetical protein SUGI_1072020 [Cryptomeria japonica]|nr:hypothetical protein SUGI_1072020 [Cryptomeria japonica]